MINNETIQDNIVAVKLAMSLENVEPDVFIHDVCQFEKAPLKSRDQELLNFLAGVKWRVCETLHQRNHTSKCNKKHWMPADSRRLKIVRTNLS